uniref:ACYPI004958 protein n=2 Tax=Sipha flava TaxID=143950 RepID=A0A2S2QJD4_9HEMI
MAFKGLSLLVTFFAFYNCTVMGATDCTLPWLVDKNPFISKVESLSINRCPLPLIGDQNKEYCCYNTNGEVECCDFQEFLVFGLICLIPILIILLIISSILSCICCLCCPCCAIYKRRQAGSCV